MLLLKEGVRLIGMSPQINLAVNIATWVYYEHGHDCIVTSVADGEHSSRSLHYSGNAVDLRIFHLAAGESHTITSKLREALTNDFDVILESDHIHIEYQPWQIGG